MNHLCHAKCDKLEDLKTWQISLQYTDVHVEFSDEPDAVQASSVLHDETQLAFPGCAFMRTTLAIQLYR
jgi:hypothetical protein